MERGRRGGALFIMGRSGVVRPSIRIFGWSLQLDLVAEWITEIERMSHSPRAAVKGFLFYRNVKFHQMCAKRIMVQGTGRYADVIDIPSSGDGRSSLCATGMCDIPQHDQGISAPDLFHAESRIRVSISAPQHVPVEIERPRHIVDDEDDMIDTDQRKKAALSKSLRVPADQFFDQTASSYPSGSVKWKRRPPGKAKIATLIWPPAASIRRCTSSISAA